MKLKTLIVLALLASTNHLFANEVQIIDVEANCSVTNVCSFNVTLNHKDTGWKHFANKWEIYTPTNKLIAKRILHHPHVDEQPFTRSLSGVKIPKGLDRVIIKAHDSVHGYSKDEFIYKF